MKTSAIVALCAAAASAGSTNLLPFLLAQDGAAFGGDILTTLALTDKKFGGKDTLPLLLASQNGAAFGGDILTTLALTDKKFGGKDTLPLLLAQDGAFGGDIFTTLALTDKKFGGKDNLPLLLASQNGAFGNDMLSTLALTGDLKKDSYQLPLLVNSMAHGAAPSLRRDVIPAMAMLGEKVTTKNMLPFMMTAGQRYANNMLPFLLANDDLEVSSKQVLPWMMTGGVANQDMLPFLLNGKKDVDMTLPLLANTLSHGASPSLRRDVIPAMAMLGEKVNAKNMLPFMMTAGQRYANNMLPYLAATKGLKDLDTKDMLPWMMAEQVAAPVVHRPYARRVIRAPVVAAPAIEEP